MKRTFVVIAVIAAVSLALAGQCALCYGETLLARGENKFALDLYAQLKNNGGENVIYSPYSISACLGMAFAGAKKDTEAQMENVLNTGMDRGQYFKELLALSRDMERSAKESGYKLNVANALWLQSGYKLKKSFTDTMGTYYGSAFYEINFKDPAQCEEGRLSVNKWVAEKTEDKIRDLIGPGTLDAGTRLVLTNAVYFYSDWESTFRKEETVSDYEFSLISGDKAKVKMMRQEAAFRHSVRKDAGVEVLEMPYKGGKLVMDIVLPLKADGITDIEGKLNEMTLKAWLGQASLKSGKVSVSIPKFKMEQEISTLGYTLKALGVSDAFDEVRADFSGMTDDPKGLCISQVIHKAFVDVSEEGTEAAAATAVAMKSEGVDPNAKSSPEFRADHPFIFVIRDLKSGCILFMGRVMDPSK